MHGVQWIPLSNNATSINHSIFRTASYSSSPFLLKHVLVGVVDPQLIPPPSTDRKLHLRIHRLLILIIQQKVMQLVAESICGLFGRTVRVPKMEKCRSDCQRALNWVPVDDMLEPRCHVFEFVVYGGEAEGFCKMPKAVASCE